MAAINSKQKKFLENLAAGQSQTDAYLNAGYKCTKESARRTASKMLTNLDIQKNKQRFDEDCAKRAELTVAEVIDGLRRIAENGMQCIPVKDTDCERHINPKAALGALELLGKYLGMFEEKRKIDLSGGVEVKNTETYDFTGISPEERLALVREAFKNDDK